ncbi:hypothetical protein CFPU101_00480 [Chroococcus sp. FPU101]|nr:hypothetical protein CFPU101_00480 [Chroococcus sp. FPU101]
MPSLVQASPTQPVTIQFRAQVGNQMFSCNSNYRLGQPATEQTLSDFRFYVSDVALIDSNGKTVPVTLEQDGKWQYQTVALLDFENKTGACTNGTVEMRDRIVGTVPQGKYTMLKFTLGIPLALNHEDSTLAPSPLNLTGLWWSWLFGYKFARIDLQNPTLAQSELKETKPNLEEESIGFPIHLGSTGCLEDPTSEKPTSCSYSNRTTVVLTGFDPMKHLVVADLEKLVVTSDLNQNQPKTAPGCMSEPNDKDCMGIMKNLGLPFLNQPATPQTFFRIEQQNETD